MDTQELIAQIRGKRNLEKLTDQLTEHPEHIETLVNMLETEKSSLKFGCEKILRLISERKPELIYPYFDSFARVMQGENKILTWGAIMTISNLAVVDSEKKIEGIFRKYFAPVAGPVMITAGNIIGNSWKIAQAKPELTDRIITEILKVEHAKYENKGKVSLECKNIVCGTAIDAFERLIHQSAIKTRMIHFVKKQLRNSRPSVRKKAERFMKLFSSPEPQTAANHARKDIYGAMV